MQKKDYSKYLQSPTPGNTLRVYRLKHQDTTPDWIDQGLGLSWEDKRNHDRVADALDCEMDQFHFLPIWHEDALAKAGMQLTDEQPDGALEIVDDEPVIFQYIDIHIDGFIQFFQDYPEYKQA